MNPEKQHFYGHGKLLLTAEYLILDGALGLCLPTKRGQHLDVSPATEDHWHWTSYDHLGKPWFEARFSTTDQVQVIHYTDAAVLDRILQLLEAISTLDPSSAILQRPWNVETRLEFPNDWGLGSSSTLVATLAQWAGISPYELLKKSFGGSGYDLACAMAQGPITYQLQEGTPQVESVPFAPEFHSNLWFIHLNQKQDSREGINRYRAHGATPEAISQATALSRAMLDCKSLKDFRQLSDAHEDLVSATLKLPKVKTTLFPDFEGSIKSLGAWGGDFVMAATPVENPVPYFASKGYSTVIPYSDMIL